MLQSSTQSIQVVAFDCDGVMFDSARANMAYYNAVLAHFGRPPMTAEQFAYAHMHTGDGVIRYLFPDDAQFQAAQAFRRQMGYLEFIQYMQIEPHLKQLLSHLRPACKTAIATNRTDTMPRVLAENGLTDAFDLVVTAMDVAKPKPDPEQLVKIMDHFGVTARQVVYIGDSELDQMAADAAGIPLIAYGNRKLQAHFHIDGLDEVTAILATFTHA